MKLRRIVRLVVPSLLVASLAIACSKDKPAEPTTESAPLVAEAEKPAEEPKPEAEADKEPKKEGEEGAEPKDPKARRTARDRMKDRRPALRHPRDAKTEAGENPDEVKPSEPGMNPSEPTKAPEPVVANPTNPDPTQPPLANPDPTQPPVAMHPIGEPTPPVANPNPANPNPTPTPSEPIVAEATTEIHGALPIEASTIMPAATVAEITGMQLMAGTPLQGIAIVPGYGSVLYAMQDPSKFGVALQVWQDASKRECDDRYRRMRLQYPNAEDVTVLTPSKAFYSYFDKLQTMVWLEPTKRMVVSVTCGETLCNQDQLVRLAKSAQTRLP